MICVDHVMKATARGRVNYPFPGLVPNEKTSLLSKNSNLYIDEIYHIRFFQDLYNTTLKPPPKCHVEYGARRCVTNN